MFLPRVSVVLWSAFRAGGLVAVLLRPSRHARSGRVLVAVFVCPRRAGAFARRWAGRLGLAVVVRRHPAGWAVSVPVAVSRSRLPARAGSLLPVAGGVRRLALVAGWLGG